MSSPSPATDVIADAADAMGSVSLRGITKIFGSATAVDSIDLEVRSGEFISLLGPSGCGKTTLLRMIAGFEHPDAGDIVVGGQSVVDLPPHKRPVNTVFQSYALFPHMTVAENVAYGLRQKRVPKSEIAQRVHDSLGLAQMVSFADRKPSTLSGGQQQRVALARALVNRPKVLLLDEPMSALDRKLREEMQIELKLLQKELGITFIFVTHDQQEALSMSDRVVVMQSGSVQQIGSTEDVYLKPANEFVAGFIGKQNFIDASVSGTDALVAADGTFAVSSLPSGARDGSEVRAAIRAEAVHVSAQRPAGGGLEGTLAGISFLGDAIQYVVVTASGLELIARATPDRAEPLGTGDTVWCSWDASELRVFEAA